MPDLEKILCVRLRSLGDAVLMTPALAALRRGLPGARIDVVLEARFAPLLLDHPSVDGVIPLGAGEISKLALARRLRASHYKAVLNFHGGSTSAFLTAVSGAPLRVGRDTYRFSFVYNRRAEQPERVFRNASPPHTVHYQASLVAALGVPVESFGLSLAVRETARRDIETKLRELDLPKSGYVLLQPTASFETKCWPGERFVDLGRELENRTGRRVVVSLPSLGSRTFGGFPVLAGLPVDELVALLSGASLYVGNDSGPMHVASALGVPVVSLFGSSDPRRWHPWGVPHRVLWAGLPCSPCHGKWCVNPETHQCLTALSTGSALDAALELLAP